MQFERQINKETNSKQQATTRIGVPAMKNLSTTLIAIGISAFALSSQAATVVQLGFREGGLTVQSNGDVLEQHFANVDGLTVGQSFTSAALGQFTFDAIGPDGNIDGDAGGLAVNSSIGGQQNWNFEVTETFTLSGNAIFQGMTFRPTFDSGELFTISSPDWTTLSITPGAAGISFAAGTFTLNSSTMVDPDLVTLADLGAGEVDLIATSGITFAFTQENQTDGVQIESLSFAAVPVPEPSTLALLGIGAGLLSLGRRRSTK